MSTDYQESSREDYDLDLQGEPSSYEQPPTPASWMSSFFCSVAGPSNIPENTEEQNNAEESRKSKPKGIKEKDEEGEDSYTKNPQDPSLPLTEKESRRQLWHQVYSYMGSNLSGMRLSLPIWLFEPTTSLTRMAETFEFSDLLDRAAITNDSILRDSLVTAFIVSTFSNNQRIRKPFNPVLGETYEFLNPVSDMKLYAEQVSHHPPISASFVQGNDWESSEVINIHAKFQGNSMELVNTGYKHIFLSKFNDYYTWNLPTGSISNIFVGKTYIDYQGSLKITNHYTGNVIHLDFPKSGWFGANQYLVTGHMNDQDGNRILLFRGAWNKHLDSCPVTNDDVKNNSSNNSCSSSNNIKETTTNETGLVTPKIKSLKLNDEVDGENSCKLVRTSPRNIQRKGASSNLERSKNTEKKKNTSSVSFASPRPSLNPSPATSVPKSIMNHKPLNNNSVYKSSSSHKNGKLKNKDNDKNNVLATDGSNRLWVAGSHLLTPEEGGGPTEVFANCTKFTKRTLAFDNDYATELPPTDSRLRPDRIALESCNSTLAAEEKLRIEQLQRDRRHAAQLLLEQDEQAEEDKEFGQDDDGDDKENTSEDNEEKQRLLDSQKPKYFKKVDDSGDKWEPIGTYWHDSRSYMDDTVKRKQASLW